MERCHDYEVDCFAYCNGKCMCLSDTRFKDRHCPFYKRTDEAGTYYDICKQIADYRKNETKSVKR